jgi:5-methylcytosine-specific restriction endonuclease McrA
MNLFDCVPALNNAKLFRRDRMMCAYCGGEFRSDQLSREHIVPASRGGGDSWMNLVAACRGCNHRKAARTPEEARMPLLFAPYVPSVYEDFILRGRHIRADVHAWLAARLPKGSRVA